MYTDKKNVLQLIALLQAHGITKVVLCPGSRNIPIVHTLSNHPDFTCYAMTDERSAGYFAIGLTLNGEACRNLLHFRYGIVESSSGCGGSLLSECSAGRHLCRPSCRLDRANGRTDASATGVFQSLVKKSVNLPEIHTDEDEWYCKPSDK